MHVGIVGAGLAGLSAARVLVEAGEHVVVWEKSRGVGGRTATRRAPNGMRFDHGAPFVHGEHADLSALPGLRHHHVTVPGGGRGTQLLGDLAANAPAKALAVGCTVITGTRVDAIRRDGRGWSLTDPTGTVLDTVDAVIVTAPAPQTAALMRQAAPALAARATEVEYDATWAVMAAWDQPLDFTFTAVRDERGLAWAIAEAPKPGRAPGERWVLHADPNLTHAHLSDPPEAVAALLLGRFEQVCDRAVPAAIHLVAHRWLYARPRTPLPEVVLGSGTLLAAGDWCGGRTAGAAVRSGRAAANALLSVPRPARNRGGPWAHGQP